MDGVRVIAFCFSPSEIRFFSREGKEFTTLKIIETSLKKLNLYDTILDGEMCIVNSDGTEDFKAIVSQIKKKTGIVEKPKYYVFDMLSIQEFDEK
jgi:ATP-dependent DNA ligase